MYITDKKFIEDSIPCHLIHWLLQCSLQGVQRDAECFKMEKALEDHCVAKFGKLGVLSVAKSQRRLKRVMFDVKRWMKDNEFDTRKALIMACEFVVGLHAAGHIDISEEEPLIVALNELREIFEKAPNEIEDWHKIERSALKQGGKFHAYFQTQGYYR